MLFKKKELDTSQHWKYPIRSNLECDAFFFLDFVLELLPEKGKKEGKDVTSKVFSLPSITSLAEKCPEGSVHCGKLCVVALLCRVSCFSLAIYNSRLPFDYTLTVGTFDFSGRC